MTRLPVPGQDDGVWGDILNDFLSVEHNPDGTQKTVSIAKGGTGAVDAATARTNLDVYSTAETDSQIAAGAGVTDHGDLTGLSDDDHTQYALADGTRGNFESAGAVAGHAADTTSVHGIADTSLLETTAGSQAKVDTHINDTSAAHAASAISVTPAGNIAATTVQAALTELDTEKLALSGGTLSGALTLTGSPSTAQHAATKGYVDSVATGVSPKSAVAAATTADISLSGTQTVDGIALIAGDRILVKDQSTGSQNGIYVVAAGAWSRSADADTSAEVTTGMYCAVSSGTANGGTSWILTTPGPITLDTTSLSFSLFSAPASHSSLQGLSSDDHPQYHNDARGDARYWQLSTDLATQAELDGHINDASSAHTASAIAFTPTGTIAATDVQAAIAEAVSETTTVLSAHESDTTSVHGIADTSVLETTTGSQSKVDTHVNDSTAAHAASAISFSPTGTVAATDVQGAIAELASESAAAPVTIRLPHTWAIAGEVKVPVGDTDFIIPFFIPERAGTTTKIVSARHRINSGTSVTCKLQLDGVDVTGYTGISVTSTSTSTDPADVDVTDGQRLALVVTAVSGTPKNLTFTVFVEYSS